MENVGYIYILANNRNNVIYTGVTNNLERRVIEHVEGRGSFFTQKYNCYKLVYFERLPDIEQAIAREKQIKNWRREWKNKIIEANNPDWRDLFPEIAGLRPQ